MLRTASPTAAAAAAVVVLEGVLEGGGTGWGFGIGNCFAAAAAAADVDLGTRIPLRCYYRRRLRGSHTAAGVGVAAGSVVRGRVAQGCEKGGAVLHHCCKWLRVQLAGAASVCSALLPVRRNHVAGTLLAAAAANGPHKGHCRIATAVAGVLGVESEGDIVAVEVLGDDFQVAEAAALAGVHRNGGVEVANRYTDVAGAAGAAGAGAGAVVG